MNIAIGIVKLVFDIGVHKSQTVLIGYWDEEIGKVERHGRNQQGRYHIWHKQPPETYSTAKYGNDLRLRSHFRSEEYNGDKGEQGAEKIGKVGNEVQVVNKDDLGKGRLFVDEIVDILRDIEDDDNDNDERNRKEESTEELPHDVEVKRA
jgi:hypothetical protein